MTSQLAEYCFFPKTTPFGPNLLGYLLFYMSDNCCGSCGIHEIFQINYIVTTHGSTSAVNVYKIDEINEKGLYNGDFWVAWLNRADVQTALHAPKIEYLRCNKKNFSQSLRPTWSRRRTQSSHICSVRVSKSTFSVATWIPLFQIWALS